MPYPYKLLAATAEKGVNVSNNMLDHWCSIEIFGPWFEFIVIESLNSLMGF